MALLGKLKDLVWEEDKPKTPQAPQKAAPASPAATPIAQPVSPVFVTITPSAPAIDDSEFLRDIENELAAQALPEYDFRKFIASTAELASVIPDEKTRFTTAFLSVKSAMGVTKEKLTETSKHYLTVIDEAKVSFQDAIARRSKEKVEKGEQCLTAMDADLKAKEEQISKLQGEVAAAKLQRDELASKVQESRAQIERSKAAFESACTKAVASINDNVDKVNRYLA